MLQERSGANRRARAVAAQSSDVASDTAAFHRERDFCRRRSSLFVLGKLCATLPQDSARIILYTWKASSYQILYSPSDGLLCQSRKSRKRGNGSGKPAM